MTVIGRVAYTSMASPKTDARNAQIRRQAHAVLDRLLDDYLLRAAKGYVGVRVYVDPGTLMLTKTEQQEDVQDR